MGKLFERAYWLGRSPRCWDTLHLLLIGLLFRRRKINNSSSWATKLKQGEPT